MAVVDYCVCICSAFSLAFLRFFSRGAVDIYQSFLVQVHDCSFDSNGFEGVVKPDYQYRGHAGGLSIGE